MELKEVRKKQQEHDEKFDTILGHVDSLYGQYKRLETEYYSLVHALRRIEDKLDKEIEERKVLKKEVQLLKKDAIVFLGKIENLEKKLKKAA